MARNENPRSGRGRGTAVGALLTRLFVAEFPVLAEYRPLAIGIHVAICDAAREASDKQTRRALALHWGSQRYLETVVARGARGAVRVGRHGVRRGD